MRLTVFLLYIVLILITSYPALADDFNPKAIYSETSKAVVLITAFEKGQHRISKGSGSIISRDGFVLTNAHIIIDKKKGLPFNNLRIYLKPDRLSGNLRKDTILQCPAKLIEFSKNLDLALLKIIPSSNIKISSALSFSDSDLVAIGDPVIAIGHPEQGGLWTLTTGTISSQINNFGNKIGKNVFQTETNLNRGNSGGPLINSHGRIVGINSMISRKGQDGLAITGINFSIKSRVAVNWLNLIGLNYKFVPTKPNLVSQQLNVKKAEIVPVPKNINDSTPQPKAQLNLQSKRKKKQPKESGYYTKIRPYNDKDLLRQVEDEMENMIDAMKNDF